MIQVSRLSVSPVKGFAVWHPDEVTLGATGVAEDRRFYLVDEDGLRFGALRHGPLVRFSARYDTASDELVFRLPDGSEVAGTVEVGEPITSDFYGRNVAATSSAAPGPRRSPLTLAVRCASSAPIVEATASTAATAAA